MCEDIVTSVIDLCSKYKDLDWCFLTKNCIEVVRTDFVVEPEPCRPIRPVRILATKEKAIMEVRFFPKSLKLLMLGRGIHPFQITGRQRVRLLLWKTSYFRAGNNSI